MGEWLRWAIALTVYPFFLIDDLITDVLNHRKYEAFKAAERQRRVDEANGL